MQCRARKSASDRYNIWGMWKCCLPCLPGKSHCCPGVWMEPRWVMGGVNHGKASFLGSPQPWEGHRGDAQLWVQGQHSLACSCHQPRTQLLRCGESAAAWEKRLEVVAGWPRPGWNPRCPSGCRGLAGSVCPVPVRQGSLVCLECAAKPVPARQINVMSC